MALTLASASPRRRELLAQLVPRFDVCPADIDESKPKYQTPVLYALDTAAAKALAVSRSRPGLVLGADTVVALGATILGKPGTAGENAEMLKTLAGKWHTVITAVVLCRQGRVVARRAVLTKVLFAPLTRAWIEAYVATGDGLDKAGGYGIQGPAGKFVAQIEGCYYNVVGLPLAATAEMLRKHL